MTVIRVVCVNRDSFLKQGPKGRSSRPKGPKAGYEVLGKGPPLSHQLDDLGGGLIMLCDIFHK